MQVQSLVRELRPPHATAACQNNKKIKIKNLQKPCLPPWRPSPCPTWHGQGPPVSGGAGVTQHKTSPSPQRHTAQGISGLGPSNVAAFAEGSSARVQQRRLSAEHRGAPEVSASPFCLLPDTVWKGWCVLVSELSTEPWGRRGAGGGQRERRRASTAFEEGNRTDSILKAGFHHGWTVDFELYAQYLWKRHANRKIRPAEGRALGLIPRLSHRLKEYPNYLCNCIESITHSIMLTEV